MAGDMPPAGGGGGGMGELLKKKAGPMPVWVWALVGLLGAWLYAKWRDSKNQASQAQSTQVADASTGESGQVGPEFVIENNLPPEANPQQPTPSGTAKPPTPGPPVVAPPGKGGHPPTGGKHPRPPVGKKPGGSKNPPTWYKVQSGDTLTSIAAKEHVKGGWREIWDFNTTPGNREPAIIATLKRRTANEIYPGEEFLIPHN